MKHTILNYMRLHCSGVRNSKPRREICEALHMEDRAFRRICEELKKEGNIATNATDGYYFVPLVSNDPIEIEALKHSSNDKRSRAYKMLDEARALEERLVKMTSGQLEMVI